MLQSDIFLLVDFTGLGCMGVLTSHEATGCDPVSHDPSFIHGACDRVAIRAHCAKKSFHAAFLS
jgi:hypothetical protein